MSNNWIKDLSFLLECSDKELKLNINASKYVLNFQLINNKYNISLFSSDGVRISFDGNRLFDMHNLKIIKGDNAKNYIIGLLNDFRENVIKEIKELGIKYGVPIKLVEEILKAICELNVNISNCLDFNTNLISINLTNDFSKQSSQFDVKKKLEIILSRDNCIKAIINLDSLSESDMFLISTDCKNFKDDLENFAKFLYNYRSFNEKYSELIDYLSKRLGNI
ncbi:hypothetical protein [Saccharolobus caldissimus]|uniref:DUF1828 domain-containing protein n=1 Tax=Saccharolobus caldissimus TaxID=1702097 RepID=A0AAQ4CTC2_9CREN|nr:hypothetical protein [Saccharolobus caldissimus]BDB99053.1 hypothetical protein SACC_20700 [Saccharolobus caldissimus]